jgi:hypothetical protein
MINFLIAAILFLIIIISVVVIILAAQGKLFEEFNTCDEDEIISGDDSDHSYGFLDE